MSPTGLIVTAALGAGVLLRLWLSARQIESVRTHRETVPAPFSERIRLDDHRKAADYTAAKVRFSQVSLAIDSIATLALTVGGGIGWLDSLWARTAWTELWRGVAAIGTVVLLSALIDLPLSVWRTFRLEARFGFNRTTPALFALDLLKSALLALTLGTPVVLAALVLMQHAGRWWWLWAWIGWVVLMLVMTWAWPALIAPLFNKFSPLGDPALVARIEALLLRCGFASQGVFVVDGSRRSAHGNAYFTGIGRNKRIVFFDTLLERLTHPEVEAVLAHELGHFRLKHVRNRLAVTALISFGALALLGWLATRQWFYTAFRVQAASPHTALLLFMFVAPVFGFFLTPLGALWSRRHEFAADAFAGRYSSAVELATALVKLYRDNANTLTPDALYAAFHYSHPPALERITRLRESQPVNEPPAGPAVPSAG